MAQRKLITDRALKALPPAPTGKRVELWDSRIPGFGIRVADTEDTDPGRRGKAAKITFILYGRFAPGAAPTRRTIGVYGEMTLERAREIAGEWRSMVEKGMDPAAEEAAKAQAAVKAAAEREKHSFRVVAEAFIADKVGKERKSKAITREMRTVFIAAWGDRQISDITDLDVLAIINPKKRATPEMARGLLTLAKRFFNWAIGQRIYGLKTSPCDRLTAKANIGEREPRKRRLTEAEIFAFWRATGRMRFPVGTAYRMLMLTALRLNECADISRPEIVSADTLIVPSTRMKGKDSKAREHLVPLSSLARDLIAKVPRTIAGEFLFSYDGGATPMCMTSKIKRDLDRRMLRTLRALAQRRGEDHRKVLLPPWVNHDIRRTVRSGLSSLRIPHDVAEAVLAHARPGMAAVYNLYDYTDEKREALELWAQRLKSIVNPVPAAPAKVVQLPRRQR